MNANLLVKKALNEIKAKKVTYLDGVSHDINDTPEYDNCEVLANAFDILCDFTKEVIEIKPTYEYLNFFLFKHNGDKTDVIVSFVTVDGASKEVKLLNEVSV